MGFAKDPRSKQGRRWNFSTLLKTVCLGLVTGCKGLGQVEELTCDLSRPARKLLGIDRRVPDTTLRNFLTKLDPLSVCQLIYVVGYDAWRRKALKKLDEFPFHAVSMDGKYPSLWCTLKYRFLQVVRPKERPAYGLLRVVTSTLVTAVGRPILGATPVEGHTNEQGTFSKAFGDMVRYYGKLFRLVMYDAGAASIHSAEAVVAAGKDYLFQIADERWVMYQTMELLLREQKPIAVEEVKKGPKRIVRKLYARAVSKVGKNLTLWENTKTIFKMETFYYDAEDKLKSHGTRYFACSMKLSTEDMTPEKWLRLIVCRWGVETSHQILDERGAFDEDNHPWITKDAQGALVVMLLRRVVFTMLTLYRYVTLRADENHQLSFRRLMKLLENTVKWPRSAPFEGLKERVFAIPPALR